MATKEEEKIILHSPELPRLSLRLQRQIADYTVDTFHLEASGHTMDQAIYGMGYLLGESRRLQARQERARKTVK